MKHYYFLGIIYAPGRGDGVCVLMVSDNAEGLAIGEEMYTPYGSKVLRIPAPAAYMRMRHGYYPDKRAESVLRSICRGVTLCDLLDYYADEKGYTDERERPDETQKEVQD